MPLSPTSGPGGGGSPSIDGGTLLLEVTADVVLVDHVPSFWTFDPPLIDTTGGDVTVGVDNRLLTVHAAGWYQVWYSFAIRASATTVKAQGESQIEAPVGTMIQSGSLGETQPHLDGAASLADLTTPFLSPPVPFVVGDTLKFRATAFYTAGSVGDAILSSNTYVCIVRLA